MLEIEIRQPKPGVCQACEGTGIIIPKDCEKRLVEVGRFCSEREDGVKRWEETMRLVTENGGMAGVGGSNGKKRVWVGAEGGESVVAGASRPS